MFKKTLITTLIILLTLELFVYAFPYIIGEYMHRPHSVFKKENILIDEKRVLNTYGFNENGARGDHYNGEAKKIAVVGSSNALGLNVDQSKTWFQQLKNHFCEPVFIESYSNGNLAGLDFLQLFRYWKGKGKKFDRIIFIFSIEDIGIVSKGSLFRYRDLYKSDWKFFRWVDILKRQWPEMLKSSRFLNYFLSRFLPSANAKNGKQKSPAPPTALVTYDHHLRHNNDFEFRYLKPKELSFSKYAEDSRVVELFTLLKEVSHSQLIVPLFFAYAEGMKEAYLDNYIMLYRHDDGTFLNEKALYDKVNNRNELTLLLAKHFSIETYNWQPKFSTLMMERDDLFLDELHLSNTGSEIFAQHLAAQLGNENGCVSWPVKN